MSRSFASALWSVGFGTIVVATACSPGAVAPEPRTEDTESSVDITSSSVSLAASLTDAQTSTPSEATSPSDTSGSPTTSGEKDSSEKDSSETRSVDALDAGDTAQRSSDSALSGVSGDGGASTWAAGDATLQTFLVDASGDGGPSTTDELDTTGESSQAPVIVASSGFIDLEPINYVRHNVSRSSSSARLFYSFQPANDDPHGAPTLVFFNGGPGYATTMGLMARGTGPTTVGTPEDSTALVPNPWSWSQLGNLLYIDTRQTGFSYSTLPDPSNAAERANENNDRNFNDYLDSADLVRVLLRVLKATPGVQDNPVVLVGESYGGVRATLMLRFLLTHENLRTSTVYSDVTLADEIAAHYALVGGRYADPRDQFPAQVLIQPFIAHTQFFDQADAMCEPGSKEARIAAETNVPCTSLGDYRDAYNIDEPAGWSSWLDVVAAEHLTSPTSLRTLLGVDLLDVEGLAAGGRTGAYRLSSSEVTPTVPSLFSSLGAVQPWDAYHVTFNGARFNDDIYDNPYPCVYFADVVSRVATFVTDADADMVVDTPVLPTTMMNCQHRLTIPFVDSVVATHAPDGDEPRPGHWTITYNENAREGARERKVRWPSYLAGHMVAASQPQQLFEDVRAFLQENGVGR